MVDTKSGAVGIGANVAPFARTPLQYLTSDVSIEDFGVLLSTVTARRRLSVGEWLATTPEPQVHNTAGRVQTSVLEYQTGHAFFDQRADV